MNDPNGKRNLESLLEFLTSLFFIVYEVMYINANRKTGYLSMSILQVANEPAGSSPMIQNHPVPKTPSCTSIFFKYFFCIHLFLLFILITYLFLRGCTASPKFDHLHYFIPLLSSIAISAITSLFSILFTLHYPSKSLHTSLWLAPTLTCLCGAILSIYGTSTSFLLGIPLAIFGVAMFMYGCWISDRLRHAERVLQFSTNVANSTGGVGKYVFLTIVVAVLYCSLWTAGVEGVAASKHGRFNALSILLLLVSMVWTMQVLRNYILVAVSDISYTYISQRPALLTDCVFSKTIKLSTWDICIGSFTCPVTAFMHNSARAAENISGDTDEFLFSCTDWYLSVSDRLFAHANRWGFVHVGANQKGFGDGSKKAWQTFRQNGMSRVIDFDVTSSICVFWGCVAGSVAGVVCGMSMFFVNREYGVGPTVYAFIIGYFVARIGMAWLQAHVSAYYVAYADDPRNRFLGSTISDRIRELEMEN